jgi:hypothetical protein
MIGVDPATTVVELPVRWPGSNVDLLMRRPGSVNKTRRSASTTKVLGIRTPLVATTTSPASRLLLMLVQLSRALVASTLSAFLLRADIQADKRLEQSPALQQFVDDRRSKQVLVLEYVENVPILDQLHAIFTHDGEDVLPTEI